MSQPGSVAGVQRLWLVSTSCTRGLCTFLRAGFAEQPVD